MSFYRRLSIPEDLLALLMPLPLTKKRSLNNNISIGRLGNTWETPWAILEYDLMIHVLLAALAVAVASVVAVASLNDFKIQL